MTRILLALLVLLLPAAAVAQEVAISDRREADGTLTLSHEVVVAAPAAEVWAAISTPEGWRTWAVPVSWSGRRSHSIESELQAGRAARRSDASSASISSPRPARPAARLPHDQAPAGFPHFDIYARVTSFFELEPVDAAHTRVRLTGTRLCRRRGRPAAARLLPRRQPGLARAAARPLRQRPDRLGGAALEKSDCHSFRHFQTSRDRLRLLRAASRAAPARAATGRRCAIRGT